MFVISSTSHSATRNNILIRRKQPSGVREYVLLGKRSGSYKGKDEPSKFGAWAVDKMES